jgi:signal transduction histidine kinase/ligand-binding sensor domain-containing protein/DNA-binding response OmpR family regulator
MTAASAQTISATKHISSADGLSNDFVLRLTVDGQGHVWAATEAGVNRIAGNTSHPFLMSERLRVGEHNSGIKTMGRITALYWYDEAGLMLVGTERGLTVFNPADGLTRQLTARDGLIRSSINDIAKGDGGVWLAYGNGQVQMFNSQTLRLKPLELSRSYGNRCIMDDGRGHLYIGHTQHGMTVVNLSSGLARNYQQQKSKENSLPGNNVRRIYQDRERRIWVGTDRGLALFHPESETFTKVTDPADRYDANIYDICQMRDGRLWVATDIGGIKTVSPSGHLQFDQSWQVRLSSLNSRSVVEDEYGNVWVGNHSTGIDFISSDKPDFSLLDYSEPVYAIAKDTADGFWIATEKELTQWQQGHITRRWPNPDNMRREYVSPRCLMADHHGGVWIGLDDMGVFRFDKLKDGFTHIPITPDGSDIHSFAEDSDGRIWIGGEFGVYLYVNGKATRHEAISNTLHAPATCIMQTAPGQLFIATWGDGTYSFDLQTMKSRHLSTREGLPSGKINQAIRDRHQGLWLGTDRGLVHVEDPVGLTGVTIYGKEQGLNDSHILALQYANGEVWMSTYSGISCFVESTEKFYNFSHHDIRMTGGFASGAAMTGENGILYFGSASGICCFNPRQMGNKTQLSDVQVITCEAYNPVGSNTEIQLLWPDEKGCVHTTCQQNTIRLAFAMRNYAQTSAVDYSYMMKGMDDKWYDIGNDHDVVFRGLRPGHYTFILRAKLRSQDWDQATDTRLSIIITPPFWRTWWAYVLYALTALAVAAYFVRSYKRKLTMHNALELERRESQQKQEMNEERLRFFTNITHELRTPLTLILGPLDDLMEDRSLSQQSHRRVSVIQKNAERLRSLINEILEFRKTETQNRRLTVARGDIGQFVREICLNYKELNRNPKVQFACNIADSLPSVWFDSEIITTVINNLLSNAIKYTDEGSITTTVETTDGTLRIAVADTGYGITPEALPHVFERYYQAKGSHQASGTGIGLALVKSLAELHEGSVSVESHEGQGSCFTFTIDIDNTYPNALHKEDQGDKARDSLDTGNYDSVPLNGLPQLLIVEDNDDIRQYIADSLCEEYRILQAANGEEGVVIAQEQMPDIIISDIMMPKMNGIELTRQLKDDIRTSHIPIILLTAKDSDEDKEEGYDSGADSYLTKPFTAKLLSSRIRNLLNARRRLAELIINNEKADKLSSAHTDGASMLPQLSRLDQEFIDRLNRLIEDHIMQENIDMAFVTDKMAMSHSTFYRKVKALTGMTATEYIRKRRLHHCYQLLESGDYNVNQAAMMTGFNQMAYFRETFKKEFGILPSEVRKK